MNEKNDVKSTTTTENNNKKKKRKHSPNIVVVTVDQNDNGDSRTSNSGSGDDPEGGKTSRKEKTNKENNKESRVDDVGDNQKDSSNSQDCRKTKTKKEGEENVDNNQVENHSSQKEDDEPDDNQSDEEIDNEHQRLTKKNSKRNSKEVVVVLTEDGDCHSVTEVIIPDGDHTPLSSLSIGPDGEEHRQSSRTTTTNPCIKILKMISYHLRLADFWHWTDLMSYIECTCAFTVVMGFLMYLFVDCPIFVESIGYTSLMMEACLALPQLIKNFNSKSTVGMSYMMVLLWAGGDLFKTGYFIIKQTPAQFIMCGVIQVTIDMLIMGQVAIYKSTPGDSSPSEKEAKL